MPSHLVQRLTSAPSIITLASALALAIPCSASAAPVADTFHTLAFSAAAVPRGVSVTGTIVDGAHWTDRDGEHWLVLTEVGAHVAASGQQDFMSAELYGYDFVAMAGGFRQVWMTQDFVKECPIDMTCAYQRGSVRLTDLDADGQAETAFVYRLACRGDPSPPDQKLLMHEGATKYALRGTAKVVMPGIPVDGGTYTVDPAFKSAPAAFLASAAALWQANLVEGPR